MVDGGYRVSLQARDGTLVGWDAVASSNAEPVGSGTTTRETITQPLPDAEPTSAYSLRPLVVVSSLAVMLAGGA